MPYIKLEHRQDFEFGISTLLTNMEFACHPFERPGNLNYIITKLLKGVYKNELRYSTFNEIIGILECAKLEMYRHIIGPYEDKKIDENGDV